MPFFFMLSGFLQRYNNKEYGIITKTKSLLIPYFFVGIIYSYFYRSPNEFIFSPFHAGYWFLLSLFSIWLIFKSMKYFIDRFAIHNIYLKVIIFLIPFLIHKLLINCIPSSLDNILSLGFTMSFYRFYILGYFIPSLLDYDKLKSFFNIFISSLILILAIFMYILNVKISPTILQVLICFSLFIIIKEIYVFNFIRTISKEIAYWGRKTLNIYLFHYFIISLFHYDINFLPNLIQVIINIVVSIFIIYITILIQKPIEDNKKLSFIFLGK